MFAINAADDPVIILPLLCDLSLTFIQIALNEAMPYMEIQQTPYVVLCVTSLGGHLSFFEIDGHRWHARPV